MHPKLLSEIASDFIIGRPTWIRTKDNGFGDRGFATATTDLLHLGADEETRTPDILHGKQVLYQLSYIRFFTYSPNDLTWEL